MPGSGTADGLLDGGPSSLVAANPTGALAGRITFVARDGQLTASPAPTVKLASPPAVSYAGAEWVAAGQISGGYGPWTVDVDYGDGVVQRSAAGPDGTFELHHTFTGEGRTRCSSSPPTRPAPSARRRARLRPAERCGGQGPSVRFGVAAAGQPAAPSLDDGHGTTAGALLKADGAAGEASVFLAVYDGAPLATDRRGLFLDVQLGGAAPGDELTLTVVTPLLKGQFDFGYFDRQAGQWVSLLSRPDLADVSLDAATGVMTVRFKTTAIFGGTVFTVSLPAGEGVQTTATVRGATASAGGGGAPGRRRRSPAARSWRWR